MGILQTFVMIEAVIVMLVDLVAAAILFRAYLKNRRKSTLAFSAAWIFDFLAIFASSGSITVSALAFTVFSALIFYGSVRFLEEESIRIEYRNMLWFLPLPTLFVIYLIALYKYTGNPGWTITAGASFGISGIFVVMGGILLRETEEIYKSAIRYLYVGIILFGIHLAPAALFGLELWYQPIGFTLSTVLIILMVTAMIKLVSSDPFLKQGVSKIPKIDLKPGVMLLNSSEYQRLRDSLKDIPALAFLRDVIDVPEKWDYYFVTTVPFQGRFRNTISPTDLGQMTELSYRYLEGLSKSGQRGVVIIDCLEYLAVYNSTESILKFLSKLRDFAVVNNGTLILVIEEESLDKRIFAQLRKIVG
ncbi:DUF835 domain-containing protein [Thermococcus sp.]